MYKILVINPGSTSTKIAVYEGEKNVLLKNLKHSSEQLAGFENICSQYSYRKNAVLNELKSAQIDITDLSAVIGRGGLIHPIESGVYEVNEALKHDLEIGVMGQHASNLGGLIADDIAGGIKGCRAYIADPVVVDELEDIARITGHPLMPRQSIFHALNQKAVARKFANNADKKYEELNLIVAHIGGGVTIGVHRKGRIVDVNNGLDGFGPFSAERAGTVPAGRLIDICFSGEYSEAEVRSMITGKGGFMAHLGTSDGRLVVEWAQGGNKKAELILKAMGYQVAKSIGGAFVALKGAVDGIILTGGMAHSKTILSYIREYIDFLGKVTVYPGEDEMEALAMNGLSVLRGDIICKVYQKE